VKRCVLTAEIICVTMEWCGVKRDCRVASPEWDVFGWQAGNGTLRDTLRSHFWHLKLHQSDELEVQIWFIRIPSFAYLIHGLRDTLQIGPIEQQPHPFVVRGQILDNRLAFDIFKE